MKPMLRHNRPIFANGTAAGLVLLAGGRVYPVGSSQKQTKKFLQQQEIYRCEGGTAEGNASPAHPLFPTLLSLKNLCQQIQNQKDFFQNKIKNSSNPSKLLKNESSDLAVYKKYPTLAAGKAATATTKSEKKTNKVGMRIFRSEGKVLSCASRPQIQPKRLCAIGSDSRKEVARAVLTA